MRNLRKMLYFYTGGFFHRFPFFSIVLEKLTIIIIPNKQSNNKRHSKKQMDYYDLLMFGKNLQ
jgi:hypothetical protein